MREVKPSFCRFCHAFCAIQVTVEDGKAVKVIGDPHNPVYHGYTCKKGRALPQQHYHPERLLHSMRRGRNVRVGTRRGRHGRHRRAADADSR